MSFFGGGGGGGVCVWVCAHERDFPIAIEYDKHHCSYAFLQWS